MLKTLVILALIANCAGGLVLIFTWATMSQRVPIIVLFIGMSLLIQGGFTILYLRGDLDSWGNIATGALFAGEGLAACVGAGGLIQGIIQHQQRRHGDGARARWVVDARPGAAGPFGSFLSGRLRPRVNGRGSA